MKKQKAPELKILAAVKKEVGKEKKNKVPRQASNNCGSTCSGDNYCSDWHDA